MCHEQLATCPVNVQNTVKICIKCIFCIQQKKVNKDQRSHSFLPCVVEPSTCIALTATVSDVQSRKTIARPSNPCRNLASKKQKDQHQLPGLSPAIRAAKRLSQGSQALITVPQTLDDQHHSPGPDPTVVEASVKERPSQLFRNSQGLNIAPQTLDGQKQPQTPVPLTIAATKARQSKLFQGPPDPLTLYERRVTEMEKICKTKQLSQMGLPVEVEHNRMNNESAIIETLERRAGACRGEEEERGCNPVS